MNDGEYVDADYLRTALAIICALMEGDNPDQNDMDTFYNEEGYLKEEWEKFLYPDEDL